MMNTVRHIVIGLTTLAAAPALAQAPNDNYPPNTVVVVTPQPVVVAGPSLQAPGAAEMPPVPAVPAAPHNEDWNNVSHINGQVVPVGERGNYLYRWKKTNISSNPIGWLVGFYGVSLSQAVGTNVAIRGDANFFNEPEGDDTGYEFGLSVPIYFKRVYQGPFIEGGIVVRDFDDGDDQPATFGPEVLFGWHWTFDSGMNVAFAFGAVKNMDRRMDADGYSRGEAVEPAGYFRVGYAY